MDMGYSYSAEAIAHCHTTKHAGCMKRDSDMYQVWCSEAELYDQTYPPKQEPKEIIDGSPEWKPGAVVEFRGRYKVCGEGDLDIEDAGHYYLITPAPVDPDAEPTEALMTALGIAFPDSGDWEVWAVKEVLEFMRTKGYVDRT